MNKLTKGMLAGAALLVAPFTQAAVIEWSYNVTTEWLDAEFSAGNGTQIENPSLISWGADGGDHTDPTQGSLDSRSGLEITNSPAMGNVFTNNLRRQIPLLILIMYCPVTSLPCSAQR